MINWFIIGKIFGRELHIERITKGEIQRLAIFSDNDDDGPLYGSCIYKDSHDGTFKISTLNFMFCGNQYPNKEWLVDFINTQYDIVINNDPEMIEIYNNKKGVKND